ncbi:MAG: HNH endonuclease signature motif containing protein [Candidatus Gracilibacteria bacterium]|jgi:hypothetical protein
MTDQELYEKAKLYGKNVLLWRRKFMGLLPEVEKRRLYLVKGFGSVFEFAFKLAGLSEEQVRMALNLEKRFSDLPALKALLERGEVSVNKLVRIQSVVTAENESFWAQQVQLLPKKALETLVRDEKSLPGQRVPLQISDAVKSRLEHLQEKGIDVSALLTELLDRHEEEIAEEKEAIAVSLPETQSRHVPVRTKKVLEKEHGSKCSVPGCQKPSEQLHHTQTFALSHRHDPHYLAPLCKEHHLIAHSINVKVQEHRMRVVK